jgi:nitrogen fixation NifU-like protein
MTPDSDSLLLEHLASPYHRGRPSVATVSSCQTNPLCGDEVELLLVVHQGFVDQAYFDGKGCAVSQAAASVLCTTIEGCAVDELAGWTEAEFGQLLGVQLSPIRERCALLAFRALKCLLEECVGNSTDRPSVDCKT